LKSPRPPFFKKHAGINCFGQFNCSRLQAIRQSAVRSVAGMAARAQAMSAGRTCRSLRAVFEKHLLGELAALTKQIFADHSGLFSLLIP
jgi:hypothetical protein